MSEVGLSMASDSPPRLKCGMEMGVLGGVLEQSSIRQSSASIMQCATHTTAHDSHVGVHMLCSEFSTWRSPKHLAGGWVLVRNRKNSETDLSHMGALPCVG